MRVLRYICEAYAVQIHQLRERIGTHVIEPFRKITEMKEITNNRDFQQGQTSSGVNAASAIAALQEAGNKNSRDIIKGEYRAFQTICYMVIERLRQFYTMPRLFRVTDAQGATKYMQLGDEQLQGVPLPESYPGQDARDRTRRIQRRQ